MRKILTGKQIKIINQLEKTFPTYTLTTYPNLARLRHSKEFPYGNKARLFNDVSNDIEQLFRDVSAVYHYMPLSYRTRIIASSAFYRLFTDQIFPSLKEKERKKKPTEKAEMYESFIMYQNFFTIGIEGLIRTMPTEFQNYLTKEIKPIMQLMESITSFYRKATGKKDIPYPYVIPDTLDYKI